MSYVTAPTLKERSIRRNLEVLFIAQLKPSLNEQKESDRLILF